MAPVICLRQLLKNPEGVAQSLEIFKMIEAIMGLNFHLDFIDAEFFAQCLVCIFQIKSKGTLFNKSYGLYSIDENKFKD